MSDNLQNFPEEEKYSIFNEDYDSSAHAKMLQNVQLNTQYLIKKYTAMTGKTNCHGALAELLGISNAKLTQLKDGAQTPSFKFLFNVNKYFKFTCDQFLFDKLSEIDKVSYQPVEEDALVDHKTEYEGLYQIYYFDKAQLKGRGSRDHARALKSGVMLVMRKIGSNVFAVKTIVDMNKDHADALFAELYWNGSSKRSLSGIDQKLDRDMKFNHMCEGELELSRKHIYVSMKSRRTREQWKLVFHRPEDETSDQYLGGLGTMLSVASTMQQMQLIALSGSSLDVSDQELADKLIVKYPSLTVTEYVDELAEFTKKIYAPQNSGADALGLTEGQKQMLVANYIDTALNETMEKNCQRTVTLNVDDDREFREYLMRVCAAK